MPLRNLMTLCIAAAVSLACYQKAVRNRHAAIIGESMRIIEQQYVEEVEADELFENAMRGMVSGLDPYSSFISSEDLEQFQESLDQEFGGIGIVVELSPETNRLTVMSPVIGTPAYRAGLRAGDTIMEVEGEDTEGMTLKESVGLMRGPPGTTVTLVIRHAGETRTERHVIERAVIPIESVLGDTRKPDGSWNFYLEEDPDIGFIRLTTFGEQTVDELESALKQYRRHPVDALILDVRSNAGGLLSTAVELCDMFIDSGKIVSTRGRDGIDRDAYYASDKTAIPTDLPMVLLVNEYSASASEILAACLQDHGRAAIVGERTYGKGTVQNVISMQGGRSALKLTTASYWRPSEQNIHRSTDATEDDPWGVMPNDGLRVELTDEEFAAVVIARRERDIVLVGDEGEELLPPLEEIAEPATDPQLQRALEYLRKQINGADRAAA